VNVFVFFPQEKYMVKLVEKFFMEFTFKIESNLKKARAGKIKTPHGSFDTPVFMPVGTLASVKALSSFDLRECCAGIILGGNTYHMMLKPGLEVVSAVGGMHRFMNWSGPMLTDSGGFQVFSLGLRNKDARLSEVTDKGVSFKSHIDGSLHFMGPKESINIQKFLGADIIMAFDECAGNIMTELQMKSSIERTNRWLIRSIKEWKKNNCLSATTGKYQALFGIIQGGDFKKLRRQSAEFIAEQKLPGIAIGGETIGYDMEKTKEVIDWISDIVPRNKPLYTMGLGRDPEDVLQVVKMGVDMFDCVAPTRMARNGTMYNGELIFGSSLEETIFESEFDKGRLNIANSRFRKDNKPVDEKCDCWTCSQGYSRLYLHHLFKSNELLYYRLSSIHNIRFMIRLTEQLREKILHSGA